MLASSAGSDGPPKMPDPATMTRVGNAGSSVTRRHDASRSGLFTGVVPRSVTSVWPALRASQP